MDVATQMLAARPAGSGIDQGVHDKHARTCADAMSRAQQALAGLQTAVAAATSGS